jgi:hypothetical protein
MNLISKAFLTLGLFATVSAVEAKLPSEIEALLDQQGTYISRYNGEIRRGEYGTRCEVVRSADSDTSISINSVAYSNAYAHLSSYKKSVQGDVTIFTLPDSGKRPGGSVCGDMDPLVNYKKTVEVTRDLLLIKESFRCLLSGKTVIEQACKI